MKWPSQELYMGKLTAHESVRGHLLKDVKDVKETNDTKVPLILIDTAGCNMEEMKEEEGVSGTMNVKSLCLKIGDLCIIGKETEAKGITNV